MDKKSIKPCWICGSPSDSREHIFKKSDFVRRYGNVPFKHIGGMLHFKSGKRRNVPGPKSKIASYDPIICSNCNNNKSQPWDRAYEIFEKWIFENSKIIFENRFIPLELVYENETYSYQCPNLYKYFVKAFGCRLASIDFPVPKDLVDLLDQEYFQTGLRLCFSINKTTFAMLPEDRDNFLGVGDLYRIDSKSQGVMERYSWYINLGWLRIWFFYMEEVPCGLGSAWTSDSACLYLGEFESATLDELIEGARRENAPALAHFENIRKNGGIKIE
jgi:hypothetical protein